MKIKKGDTVLVLAGRNKGKRAKVINVAAKSGRLTVEGVNVAKRHQRPTRTFQGGIIEKPLPMPVGKVMLVCPRCSEPTRVALTESEGRHVRRCKKCEEIVDKV
ncbi:MAG: 50S ribosomal protein L24 [Candidatus Saganbacteria bacterium]|nr:50S ribosomal protein L24 [Candidatus Saganbacteria bacterium]